MCKFLKSRSNEWQAMYIILFSYRLLSRVVMIPFREPSIRARTNEQRAAFTSLKDLKNKANSSIASYIRIGKTYKATGVFKIDEYEEKLSTLLPNCGGRVLKGYANLLWFTKEVSTTTSVCVCLHSLFFIVKILWL